MRALVSDIADLVLARSCAGCEAPGSVLCPGCWSLLTRDIIDRDLPDGATARAATHYLGIGKSVVIAHKEHGWHALTPALGALLARAIVSITDEPVALVPIPPHAHAVASRGTDPLADIVTAAVRALRAVGQMGACAPLLTRTHDAGALKLLGREERRQAVQSSFTVSPRSTVVAGCVIVVDDVITTGMTVSEARRTLEAAGIPVRAVAAVASTPLRGSSRQPG